MSHIGEFFRDRRHLQARTVGYQTLTTFDLEPNRRRFLQTAAAVLASSIVPSGLRARENDKSFWFLNADFGESWPVADPVKWSLENARKPVLERAEEGLSRLAPLEGDRIIRLVTRRCGLNLIELLPQRVIIHHWSQEGRADLRPFFKTHGLVRKEIEVIVRDRKREESVTLTGEDFQFGDPIAPDFPVELFQRKWRRRFEGEEDDWSAAPNTLSGYAWEGIEDDRIPWAAIKSAWRRNPGLVCLNCNQPTLLANFGFPMCGMFNRSPRFRHTCGNCRRSFKDDSVKDVGGWIMVNLDAEVQPAFMMVWGRRVKLERPINKPVL
jgi:hypothetical protein